MPSAFITGCAGTALADRERAFLRDANPWGFILFARNIADPAQVRALCAELRDAIGRDAPILIDQEGGRVARLRPPHWRAYPPGRVYGDLFRMDAQTGIDAAQLGARLIAADLHALGIDVDCLPIADVPVPGADAVIGDRAYGDDVDTVVAISEAVAQGLLAGGVLPVLKHVPGHGRANADSHEALPNVGTPRAELERTDFAAFKRLAHLPLGMTAHVIFADIDEWSPATTSRTMIDAVIRGFIGFDGLLMSDDVSMGALSGTIGARSSAAIRAGCDVVLHCNGKMHEMEEVASAVPALDGIAAERAERALALRQTSGEFDGEGAWAAFSAMLAKHPANSESLPTA